MEAAGVPGPNTSSTLRPSARASPSATRSEGSDLPDSAAETACRDTPTIPASCFWERPLATRASRRAVPLVPACSTASPAPRSPCWCSRLARRPPPCPSPSGHGCLSNPRYLAPAAGSPAVAVPDCRLRPTMRAQQGGGKVVTLLFVPGAKLTESSRPYRVKQGSAKLAAQQGFGKGLCCPFYDVLSVAACQGAVQNRWPPPCSHHPRLQRFSGEHAMSGIRDAGLPRSRGNDS